MGLDFSVLVDEPRKLERAHFGYSGFHAFRCRLAKDAGFDFEEACQTDEWPDDPIVELLNHSDCDGFLLSHECESIYPRLLELVGKWDESDWQRTEGEKLARMMKRAAESFGVLQFR